MDIPALLALEDGSLFHGISIGVSGQAVGEIVFNTSMTGYQEIITDPSYAKQFVTLTYPHIGNVGCNQQDTESDRVWAEGLIIRDLPTVYSNWRAEMSLSDYLQQQKVVGIAEIDTRQLTRLLRDKGAQNGCLMAGEVDEAKALELARGFVGLKGMDLAKVVSCEDSYQFKGEQESTASKFHVVAYDFGVKHNILRLLENRGCQVTVVPAQTSADEVLAMKPNGVFLSNGPGDPEPCDYAIKAIQQFLQVGLPMFGICLGHQLLALAVGGKTEKMKFGHHGGNHPVQDLATKQVMITTQNHCFAVDYNSLPKAVEATHVSLFDGSLQGIRHTKKPAYSFQGHPEASPGPHDLHHLFDQFIHLMTESHAKAN